MPSSYSKSSSEPRLPFVVLACSRRAKTMCGAYAAIVAFGWTTSSTLLCTFQMPFQSFVLLKCYCCWDLLLLLFFFFFFRFFVYNSYLLLLFCRRRRIRRSSRVSLFIGINIDFELWFLMRATAAALLALRIFRYGWFEVRLGDRSDQLFNKTKLVLL